MNLHQIISGAVSTEKSLKNQESDQFTFLIRKDATKIDVKNAFQKFWGVKVSDVRIVATRPKFRKTKFGTAPKRLVGKKAIVKFAPGEKFDLLKFAGEKSAPKKTAEKNSKNSKPAKK